MLVAALQQGSRRGDIFHLLSAQVPMNVKTLFVSAVIAIAVVAVYKQQQGGQGVSGNSHVATPAAIQIYTASYCGVCAEAKAYMNQRGIEYTEYDIEKDEARHRELDALGAKGIPYIVMKGAAMEGFDAYKFETMRRNAGI
ncbi:glutaredoxin family protein [Aquabacterium sp. A7-Y]|uniref:glutaredoxin family protein n=1 Tax=Aquabacterium sp. A7-Y TaxID=1349605 RepID=UPI00223D170F|nr:glutaredoxin domain-containing protein [Aquabacterium sp. A7-Y]MCW7536815.1 glutaredoxin family protein [Aquabacterium sp. A7-Y]